MAVIGILTKQYAVCVYIHGIRKFETVAPDYVAPVKQYAADNYTLDQIDNAYVKGHINEQEYQDTISYIVPVE